MGATFPYVTATGNISRVLIKIQEAATPTRFTQDFLETKLGMSGGGARPLIPFLKRIGFLASDGTPTELYKKFRNSVESGAAAAAALKHGYSQLYEANEYAHDLTDQKLKGLLIQLTGEKEGSNVIRFIMASFKALKEHCNFNEIPISGKENVNAIISESPSVAPEIISENKRTVGMNLSYTINLNLPATSDIAVFHAIFKSLKENLLKD